MMLSHDSTTVRIASNLIKPIDDLIKNAKDEFGIPLFRSRCDVVTKAVQDFLKEKKKLLKRNAE